LSKHLSLDHRVIISILKFYPSWFECLKQQSNVRKWIIFLQLLWEDFLLGQFLLLFTLSSWLLLAWHRWWVFWLSQDQLSCCQPLSILVDSNDIWKPQKLEYQLDECPFSKDEQKYWFLQFHRQWHRIWCVERIRMKFLRFDWTF